MEAFRFAAFIQQQGTFALEAPAIAAELAITAHHTMTGNRHSQLVHRAGLGHGAYGLGATDAIGDFAIAHRDARGDFAQGAPNPALESSALDIQGQRDPIARRFDKIVESPLGVPVALDQGVSAALHIGEN
jgi:hypothetical protein